MAPDEIKRGIDRIVASEGITLWGAAENRLGYLHDELFEVAGKMRSLLVFAVRVSPAVLNTLKDAPNRVYFHHYKQLNYLLDRTALKVSLLLQAAGFNALPIAASQTLDATHQKGHLSHREAAVAAGLGWIGRNNLLVAEKYGSQVRLVTVLSEARFDSANAEALPFGCGSCYKCLEACPAGAIKEKPEDFDHLACYEQLRRFSKQTGISQYICGLCVKACSGFQERL